MLDGTENIFYIISLLSLLIVAIVVIVGTVVRWSRHQDDLNNMVIFCIKYLIESKNIQEKMDAAKALGHAKDPAALLVLVDVTNDRERQESDVRHAAIDALYEMSSHYKKYNKLITSLLKAIEQQEHQKVIDILINYFELNNEKKYVQSAYIIAREYIKLKHYDVAREWLHKAEFRNVRNIVYINEISELIQFCNHQLFLKGDSFYRSQNYFEALELYSLVSSGLDDEEKQHYSDFLRIACVYYKLERYNDALESTLLALHHNQRTDNSLLLEQLLQKRMQINVGREPQKKERYLEDIHKLNKHVDQIMHELFLDSINQEDSLVTDHKKLT